MNILHIVSIICFAVCLVSFFYLKWYVKKRTSLSGNEERRSELARQEAEAQQLIEEIDMITDRDTQLVEDRINKLKELLYEVDKRIAVYEKDLESFSLMEERMRKAAGKTETLYTSLGKGIRAAFTAPDAAQVPLNEKTAAPQSETNAPPPVSDQNAAVSEASRGADSAQAKKQIRAHIDILADEGRSPDEIAKRLNISIAEVNLAMNLRRKN